MVQTYSIYRIGYFIDELKSICMLDNYVCFIMLSFSFFPKCFTLKQANTFCNAWSMTASDISFLRHPRILIGQGHLCSFQMKGHLDMLVELLFKIWCFHN